MNSANQHLPQIWIPVAIYLIAMLYIGYYSNKIVSASKGDKFLSEYFLGSRSFGGYVVAMTLVATT